MATTNEDITLSGSDITVVSLTPSTAFIVQNTKNDTLRFKVKDSVVEGGQIPPGESFEFNYDIDLWNPHGEGKPDIKVYLVRS